MIVGDHPAEVRRGSRSHEGAQKAERRWGAAVTWVRPNSADGQITVSLDPADGPASSIRFDPSGDDD